MCQLKENIFMSSLKNSSNIELKLFHLGFKAKLLLISCTAILWFFALVAYLIPNFNHWFLLNFNGLRTQPLFASLCFYYTRYMIYAIIPVVLILYLAAFKVNKLRKYRMVLLLAVMTLAIGIPLVDLIKLYTAVPRPWILYPDINSLYHSRGTSFPSGHAFQAFAGTLPLIICFLTNDGYFKRNQLKTIFAVILLVFAITLSFSRILAGMHYLTDVLFGIGFAIFLMVILAIILQKILNKGYIQMEKWYALLFLILIIIDLIYL